jgi:hypothetical protein
MEKPRSLALRREVLAELADVDLGGVAGGGGTILNTCFSCLTYVSCNPVACLVPTRDDSCVCAEP